jgi:predicted membrane-bound mannosyltransferase
VRLRRPSGELLAYGALVVVALALRFYQLGDRPFHHDESQDAYFSWVLWS